jgi:hypothetical protein
MAVLNALTRRRDAKIGDDSHAPLSVFGDVFLAQAPSCLAKLRLLSIAKHKPRKGLLMHGREFVRHSVVEVRYYSIQGSILMPKNSNIPFYHSAAVAWIVYI